MHVGYVGAFADEQSMAAAAPVVVIEIGIDAHCVGICELRKVFHNRKVHAIGHQLVAYLSSHGEQAIQSGDGDSKVGVMVATLVAVEDQAFDFILV